MPALTPLHLAKRISLTTVRSLFFQCLSISLHGTSTSLFSICNLFAHLFWFPPLPCMFSKCKTPSASNPLVLPEPSRGAGGWQVLKHYLLYQSNTESVLDVYKITVWSNPPKSNLWEHSIFIFNWKIITTLMVCATHLHESAIHMCISPPFWTSLPPERTRLTTLLQSRLSFGPRETG